MLKISGLVAFVLFLGSCYGFVFKNQFCGSLKGGCNKAYKRFLKNPNFFKGSVKSLDKIKGKLLEDLISICLKEGQTQKVLNLYERLLQLAKKERSFHDILFFEEKLAELSFSVLKNYEKALKYYVSLLGKALPLDKKIFIGTRVAESFFLLNKPLQALREVSKLQKFPLSIEQERQVFFLKARVFSTLDEEEAGGKALDFFHKMIKKYPKEADYFREYLALTYEERKDFLSAIEELEKIKPSHVWMQEKIRRLKERQKNQPGFDF